MLPLPLIMMVIKDVHGYHTMNAGGQIEDGELGETVLIIKPLILL